MVPLIEDGYIPAPLAPVAPPPRASATDPAERSRYVHQPIIRVNAMLRAATYPIMVAGRPIAFFFLLLSSSSLSRCPASPCSVPRRLLLPCTSSSTADSIAFDSTPVTPSDDASCVAGCVDCATRAVRFARAARAASPALPPSK